MSVRIGAKDLKLIGNETRRSIQPEKYLLEVPKLGYFLAGAKKMCSTNIAVETRNDNIFDRE